jgi:hypothetical protein
MWKAGAEQIPKLTVRVRFPSPAPSGERPGGSDFRNLTRPGHGGPRTRAAPRSARFAWHANRCYARPSFSLPLSGLGSCRNGAPASRCDRLRDQRPRDHPAIMAGARKLAKTGTTAASYMRTAAAVPGPLILAEEGQSPSPARAELAFHRTRDATCRCSTRWPRGGLSRAGPCTPRRRTAIPPAGLAEWQGNGADDEQPSR